MKVAAILSVAFAASMGMVSSADVTSKVFFDIEIDGTAAGK